MKYSFMNCHWLLAITILFQTVILGTAVKCPKHCWCSLDLKIINCLRRNLKSIPADIPVQVMKLYLGHNHFKVIPSKSFETLSALEYLDLQNCKIETLQPEAFAGLSNLTFLSLNFNKLEKLDNNTFNASEQLEVLYLGSNHLTSIPALELPTLRQLNLDSNFISNATFPDSFTATKSLEKVILTNNVVVKIDQFSFKSLSGSGLKSLSIKKNKLASINDRAFVPISKSLAILILDSNSNLTGPGVKTIFKAFKNSFHLRHLSLRKVGITCLPDNFFKDLSKTHLKSLVLSGNSLTTIGQHSFVPLVRHLRSLHLSWANLTNDFIGKNNALLKLTNLTELWLDGNKLTTCPRYLPPTIQHLYVTGNQIKNLSAEHFKNLTQLVTLSLSENLIKDIPPNTFRVLEELTQLILSKNHISEITKDAFAGLDGLEELDLSSQTGPLTKMAKLTLRNLTTLVLSNNNLAEFFTCPMRTPFRGLSNLRTLYIDQNKITSLTKRTLSGLSSLESLYAGKNQITTWKSKTFAPCAKTLTLLDLAFNKISTIRNGSASNSLSRLVGSGGSLRVLDLGGNPFNCTCTDLAWLVNWITTTNKTHVLGNSSYVCKSPPKWDGKAILKFRPNKYCVKNGLYGATLLSVVLGCLAMVVVGVVLLIVWLVLRHRRRASGYSPLSTEASA